LETLTAVAVGRGDSQTGPELLARNCESLVNQYPEGCIFNNSQVELGREAYHLRSGG
jgi:hypothetical protein